MRVPSDGLRSLANTCSPRRPQAARRSARSASWCAAPSTRLRRSRHWVRHRLRSASRPGPLPPPRASTRTAGHSVVTSAPAGQDRRRDAHRSASRRSPITRRGATDQPAGARSGRTGKAGRARAPTPSGRLRAARALGARRTSPPRAAPSSAARRDRRAAAVTARRPPRGGADPGSPPALRRAFRPAPPPRAQARSASPANVNSGWVRGVRERPVPLVRGGCQRFDAPDSRGVASARIRCISRPTTFQTAEIATKHQRIATTPRGLPLKAAVDVPAETPRHSEPPSVPPLTSPRRRRGTPRLLRCRRQTFPRRRRGTPRPPFNAAADVRRRCDARRRAAAARAARAPDL